MVTKGQFYIGIFQNLTFELEIFSLNFNFEFFIEKMKKKCFREITDPRTGKRKLVEMESISKKQIRQELERVKFSVQQFGLQAYNPTERRKLERDRLIRLGAKAPKKEWKNYKGFLKNL